MFEIFYNPTMIFIFSSPQEWILVAAAFALLFGANKLPELAKSIGKTRNAFKEGMREADEEAAQTTVKNTVLTETKPVLSEIDDETLMTEINRRKAKQLSD
ncbi:MAG: twin-arginine translocase TatA/TatE family subunit [Actinomycetota bacterium]